MDIRDRPFDGTAIIGSSDTIRPKHKTINDGLSLRSDSLADCDPEDVDEPDKRQKLGDEEAACSITNVTLQQSGFPTPPATVQPRAPLRVQMRPNMGGDDGALLHPRNLYANPSVTNASRAAWAQ